MPLKIFIVEDSQSVRENLVATLREQDGDEVEFVGHAETETSACAWLAEQACDWDLILLDLFLRGGNGLGVLQCLLDRPIERKVVVISNYATPEIKKRCLQLNADRVFDKAREMELLLAYCAQLQGR